MTAKKFAAIAIVPTAPCAWCGVAPAVDKLDGFCTSEHAARWEASTATPQEREAVEYLAGQRNPENLIAAALEVTPPAWARIKKGDAQLREALSRGRAREHKALVDSMFEEALAGNVNAATFLLKCRHGYNDRAESEPSRVQVAIMLPAALTDAQYSELRRVASGPSGRAEVVDALPLPEGAK